MKAIQKINNNVAICIDGKGKELVAFGKGLGFPTMPYEITDLNQISMTFYRIDKRYYQMLEDISSEIFEVSAEIVNRAQGLLPCELNPNIVVNLSDHINFSITRLKKYKNLKISFAYDVEELYPAETEIGRYAVNLILKKLGVKLPDSEITNIAMHFINAREETTIDDGIDAEYLIDEVTGMVDRMCDVTVDRKGFSFNRFATHLRHYFKRAKEQNQLSKNYGKLIHTLKSQSPKIYECSRSVVDFVDNKLGTKSTEEEFFYIMIHINRMVESSVQNMDCNKNG